MMDLYCAFFLLEILDSFQSQLAALGGMQDAIPEFIYQPVYLNVVSQMDVWRILLCGGGW